MIFYLEKCKNINEENVQTYLVKFFLKTYFG